MNKMLELIDGRFASDTSPKVKALAKQSSDGRLTSFSGLFKSVELGTVEKIQLEELLHKHTPDSRHDIKGDLALLSNITSEIKAISNQAAILHGERIKRAQKILKSYKEGAFSAWLMATYGNRQTPYNFLLYYELYEQLPHDLKEKAETLPRQAIYTLASRDAPFEAKKAIISSYKGQTKREMLEVIRERFPLPAKDRRKANMQQSLLTNLEKLIAQYQAHEGRFETDERQELANTLKKFLFFVTKAKP